MVEDLHKGLLNSWKGKAQIFILYDEGTKPPNDARASGFIRYVLESGKNIREQLGINYVPYGCVVDPSGRGQGKGIS